MQPEHFPRLRTARFVLRRIGWGDQEQVFAGLSDPEVIRYYGVSYATLEATAAQLRWFEELLATGTGIWWGICRAEEPGTLLGACGFNEWKREHRRAEIGFWLRPAYWKQGVMTEVVPTILRYGFGEMGLHRVEAIVEGENDASAALLRRLGFQYEGTHRECEIKHGRFIDLAWYGLLSDWAY
ncbi:MAG TPA: GNAT family protein [bacterium]|nr:GNAT family protein [bacterium]